MKRIVHRTARAAALALLAAAGPAAAEIGALDHVPAATLLLPYFEVSTVNNLASTAPASAQEDNTVLQVRNASAQPQLARVTLWTDYGIPTFGFDVYLNGNDSQSIDLRLLFAGVLPVTGTGASRPNNVSGANPPPFPGCAAKLNSARLPAAQRTALANAHRGLVSTLTGNSCGGRAYGDNNARGYITIDAVNSCSAATTTPASAAYFVAGGSGVASNQNVLFGDYTVTDAANNRAWGDRLVAIEADAAHPLTSQDGRYTFYGGFVGFSARDNREALATNWKARHLTGGAFDNATDLVVWRDPRGTVTPGCASVPAPWERPAREILLFDEQSTALVLDPTRTPLGLAAQRLRTTTSAALPGAGQPYRNFYTPFAFGLTRLNLNDGSAQSNPAPGAAFALVRQAWVATTSQAAGRFQTGSSGIALDLATSPSTNTFGTGIGIAPQIATTTSIVSDSPDPSVAGQPYTVQVSVVPNPGSGQVTISGAGACVVNLASTTSCTVENATTPGSFTVVARFTGSITHAPSTSPGVSHTVTAAAAPGAHPGEPR